MKHYLNDNVKILYQILSLFVRLLIDLSFQFNVECDISCTLKKMFNYNFYDNFIYINKKLILKIKKKN